MRKLALVALLLMAGCAPAPETRQVRNLDSMQGTWKIVHVTDPQGNAYEGDMKIEINGNKAISDGQELRLEFNADGSYLRLYAGKTDPKDNSWSQEKLVSEVTVVQTVEPPTMMLWTDKKNPKQETMLEKK